MRTPHVLLVKSGKYCRKAARLPRKLTPPLVFATPLFASTVMER